MIELRLEVAVGEADDRRDAVVRIVADAAEKLRGLGVAHDVHEHRDDVRQAKGPLGGPTGVRLSSATSTPGVEP
jgi:hypothetical protein